MQRALETVLEERIPYLLAPIREIHSAIQTNGSGELNNTKQLELEVQLKVSFRTFQLFNVFKIYKSKQHVLYLANGTWRVRWFTIRSGCYTLSSLMSTRSG